MKSKRRLTVAVLIDALGWEYVKDRGFLDDLLPYRRPLRTILGFSSGAIPTILTGVPPAQHGHWNLYYYDPQGSPFWWLRYFPARLLDNRIGRRALKELGRRVLGLGPTFECCVKPQLLPYFNWVEKKNIYEAGGITGSPSIFDQLQQAHIAYCAYSYHKYTDTEILRRSLHDIRSTDASFLLLYLSEMDMFLHTRCSDPEAVGQKLKWYADGLRVVFDAAREIDEDVSLCVFSDHGMTPVRHHYDLVKDIDAVGLRMPVDYLAVYDSTMARFWFFSEDARERITGILHSSMSGRILPDGEMRDMGVFFSDRRFGEVIFLLNPGWILSRSDFNGPQWKPAGMHGYHPDDRFSDAVFLSNHKPAAPTRTISDVHDHLGIAAGLTAMPMGTSRQVSVKHQ